MGGFTHITASKMKTFVALLMVMMVGMAAVDARKTIRNRRFLLKEIQDALNSVGDFFTKQYNSAKDAFNKAVSGIDFDAAVNALIPMINSDMTVTACVATCTGASATVLGPAAVLAGTVCTPLCDGALAKLEEMAG